MAPYYESEGEQKSYTTLPEGDYRATVIDAVETKSKASGNDMIKLTVQLEHEGKIVKLFEYLTFSAKMAWKIDSFMNSIGRFYKKGDRVNVDAEDLIGSEANVRIGVEEYNGYEKNKVKMWLKPEGHKTNEQPSGNQEPEDTANEIEDDDIPF